MSDTGGHITPKIRLYANPISGKVSVINRYDSKCEPLEYLTEDISETVRGDVKKYLDDGYKIYSSRVMRRLKGDDNFKGVITLGKDDHTEIVEVYGTTHSILERDSISLLFPDDIVVTQNNPCV